MTSLQMTDLSVTMSNSQLSKNRRKNTLGRGLSSLIPGSGVDAVAPREYFNCALDKIDPAEHQPRKRFDAEALSDLAASIKESGLIQPLVVREKDGRYELIAGERRWRASQMAGLTEVPVVVKDVSDSVAFALALIENIQRQDLNPVEEAMAYRRLMDEFGFTQAELADQVGKSRSAIANSVRLLGLGAEVLEFLSVGELTSGHARALLTLDEAQALALANEIIEGLLTVRQTEQRVKELKGLVTPEDDAELEAAPAEAPAAPTKEQPLDGDNQWRVDESTQEVVEKLRHRLDAKIQLKDKHGKGRIEIHYDNYEVLKSILAKLNIDAGLI